jgi:hypothetical protein
MATFQLLIDGLGSGIAGGDHHPHHARLRLKRFYEVLDGEGADGSLGRFLFDGVGRAVVGDHAVAALHQAQDHVAAHAAQADHPHLHGQLLRWTI